MGFFMRQNPNMDINLIIASNIKRLMQETPGLDTFKKVAAKAQIGFGTVQRAHNGTGNVTASNLHALAKAFGVTLADLTSDKTGALPVSSVIHVKPVTIRQKRITTIHGYIDEINETGLAVILDKCRDVLKEYPIAPKETQSS